MSARTSDGYTPGAPSLSVHGNIKLNTENIKNGQCLGRKNLRELIEKENRMKLTSMKLPKRSTKDAGDSMPVEVGYDEKYPSYGLVIRLETESLSKLGLKASNFKVGQEVTIMAKAEVEETSERERQNGKNHQNVSFQITSLGIEGAEKSKFQKAQDQENSQGGVVD